MIVKNEAHCIKKSLESIKSIISYWVICDTGSTDNTCEIIKETLKDIPGELHHHEWQDFATNRNKAIDLCKGKAEYIITIDADDFLEIDHFSNDLIFDSYYIKIIHGNIQYNRIVLFKANKNFKFIGIIHEYLHCDESTKSGFLPNIRLHIGGNGARSQNSNKYLHDAKILETALVKEPNNSRYVFYCAQSYRDAKEYKKSLKYYIRRSEMSGWIEEIFYSLFQAGKLMIYLNYDFDIIESTFIKAYNLCPTRNESLCYLSALCRERNLFDKGYFYAKIGSKINKPDFGLFVENECYDWQIFDEMAVCAYYIGLIEEAKNINLLLLNMVPEKHKSRINNNLQFCRSGVENDH